MAVRSPTCYDASTRGGQHHHAARLVATIAVLRVRTGKAPMRTTTNDIAQYCLFDAAIGTCGLAWTGRGIARVQLPERSRSATERRLADGGVLRAADPPPTAATVATLLQRYFAGEPVGFDEVVLDLGAAGALAGRIYAATRALKWGETASYGEVARRAGAPGAAQAVGQAMARNRMPVIIPCHRVLASGDRMGGFSAYGGVVTKQRLLELEGVYPGSGTPLLPGLLD
jgi:methylated-DNA-[protein]-cysteine S-methyltransferase